MTSHFNCNGCGEALSWAPVSKFCDLDNRIYCASCIARCRECQHLLSNITFALPSERGDGPAPIICNICRTGYPSNNWLGNTCYIHNYDICKACITRPGHGSELLRNHRLEAHPSIQPVDWVIHANKRPQTIDPTPTGAADPKSPNFDTMAHAKGLFGEAFKIVTGRYPS